MVPVKSEVGKEQRMNVRFMSPSQTGFQAPGQHWVSHVTFQVLGDVKPHPVKACGVPSFTAEGVEGFLLHFVLQWAPGPPTPCFRGIQGHPSPVTGKI